MLLMPGTEELNSICQHHSLQTTGRRQTSLKYAEGKSPCVEVWVLKWPHSQLITTKCRVCELWIADLKFTLEGSQALKTGGWLCNGRIASKGEAACQQINAEIYLECSAKCRENIENVFKEATTIALSAMKKAKRQKKQRACSVLWSGLQESIASYEPSYSDFNNGVTTLFFPQDTFCIPAMISILKFLKLFFFKFKTFCHIALTEFSRLFIKATWCYAFTWLLLLPASHGQSGLGFTI